MLFSIIIPTCNRNDLLSKCLDQVIPQNQTSNIEYEIIVSDDSKDNQAKKLIAEKYPNVKWFEGPKRGPASNRNNGANQAKGEWLVFFDDDCQPSSNILETYLNAIHNNIDILVFEGAIDCKEKIDNPLYASPINLTGGYLWSCNFCVRKDIFKSINGFDENFIYPNLEDNDLHFRLKKLKVPMMFIVGAVVYHPPRKIADPVKLSKYHGSWLYYHKKIGEPKTLVELLKTIFKNRILYIKDLPFSKDSFIAFKNMNIELIYTVAKYGFGKKVKHLLKPLKQIVYSKNVVFKSTEFNVGKGSMIKVDGSSQVVFEGYVNIEHYVIIRAINNAKLTIGKDVFIGDYSTIRVTKNAVITIGDNTMIAQDVKIISTNHQYNNKNILIKEQDIIEDKMNIIVGSDCWLGAGCIVLPGVTIGNGVVVGAHSVVTKDIPDYAVAVGNPAKVIKYRQ